MKFKNIRKYGRLISALYGFLYDYYRYVRFSGWSFRPSDIDVRNYHLVKVYHALEKSMTFRKRNPASGWRTVYLLLDLIKNRRSEEGLNYYENNAINNLRKFCNLPENIESEKSRSVLREIDSIAFKIDENNGFKNYSLDEFEKGKLASPEEFFYSRYSLREFKEEKISAEIIDRVIRLARKTPSVCNRQCWHVYHTSDRLVIDEAFKIQSGNRGFGDKVRNLFVITSDLKGFMSGNEHYQHWIDGGMFSMSLIYALHSLGIASCCLNWSQSPSNDILLRNKVKIKSNHTIIMLLAFGYPELENKVCVSERRPLSEICSELMVR